jgi:predicted TIM-barrel fold metal-dependent hydrolase
MIVDFHAYLQTRSFLERLRRRSGYPRIESVEGREVILSGPGTARPIRHEQNDIDKRLEGLTRAGVLTQVLRLQHVSGVDAFPAAEGLEIAQEGNEELAGLAKAHPDRFVPFAAVPMKAPDHAVIELHRAVHELGHRGVGISASCDGVFLDDAKYEPVLAKADELRVPVFVLPNHPSVIDDVVQPFDWLTGAIGFQVDLTVVALRLVCSGIFERHPTLNIVLANLGGFYPFTMLRLDHFWERMAPGRRPLPTSPSQALRSFWMTTASGHQHAIRLAAEVLGPDRLLFGSDYPSFEVNRSLAILEGSGLARDDLSGILGGNAQHLLSLRHGR